MDHRQAVATHYDDRAATYDRSAMHAGLAATVADLIGTTGGVVLDVATGTGLVLRSLSRHASGATLAGVDMSARMLEVARAALPGASWVRADATRLPITSRAVDLLTCVTALHLFDDPAAVFCEWQRVTRPGSLVVTATFTDPRAPLPPQAPLPFARRHDSYRSVEQVARAMAPHGFALEHHTTWAYDHDQLLITVSRREP